DDYFSPKKITIKRGSTVKWVWSHRNLDSHNVTLMSGPKHVDVFKFSSETAVSGIGFTRKFKVTGTYHFECTMHTGMKVTVIVKSRRDEMMDRRVTAPTRFAALAYRPYAPGFARPLGPATIPGPLLEAQTGDTLVVNFQNATSVPVTMHPHGIFYASNMDGAY